MVHQWFSNEHRGERSTKSMSILKTLTGREYFVLKLKKKTEIDALTDELGNHVGRGTAAWLGSRSRALADLWNRLSGDERLEWGWKAETADTDKGWSEEEQRRYVSSLPSLTAPTSLIYKTTEWQQRSWRPPSACLQSKWR